jgi:hypothetical protein
MKTRYYIIIGHILLYPIVYFTFLLCYHNPSPVSLDEGLELIVLLYFQFGISLIVLAIIPLIGFLIGLILKKRELKIGFLVSIINAIAIFICVMGLK